MPLNPGTRIGPYEVSADLGSGGMGDVYRARDTRLDRDVAVKTIKGPFTDRFEREARAISALNHPNICTLYDVGQHEGSGYLVMEYVEGRPIGGPLPIEQALEYGVQICEALHAAHRKGIVHRDLKPANILLTKQGVKLLDFGLAKLDPTSSAVTGANSDAERATIAALTGAHTVVGTPQYMAPEQIEGREVDARADVFAFGCVLYELLTGRRAFDGRSASTVMAAVLASAPTPLEQLVPLTPPALERVITRCLAKDPDERWQTAKDVAAELQWIAQGGARVGLPAVVGGRRRTRERLVWAVAALSLVAAGVATVAWARRAPQPPPVVRFDMAPPEGTTSIGPPAVSPDGRLVAFSATGPSGRNQIWVRALDSAQPRALAGTEGVRRSIFWSPDSRYIAYMESGKLKKIDVSGGPPQTICDAPTGSDGTWGIDGTILFDGRGEDPIWRVPAAGGVAQPIVSTNAEKKVTGIGWPEFLSDGRHYLYVRYGATSEDRTVNIGTLDSPDSTVLMKAQSRVAYAEPGYLLYVRERTLVAQPFDPRTLKLAGEAVPISEGLGVDTLGLATFSASRTGVLVFRAGEIGQNQLVWVDRAGKESPLLDRPAEYGDAWLSPDGTRLAYDVSDPGGRADIWIRDLVRGVNSRFTFDPVTENDPIWSHDGRRIVFTTQAHGPGDLHVKDVSGTREPEPLLVNAEEKYASDWSRDGRWLLYVSRGRETSWDVMALPLDGDRKPVAVARTKFGEMFGTFSPDGKYVAYSSNEAGRRQVYVQEFPEPQNKIQVSTDGGAEPFWRGDGRELYYSTADGHVMAVPVSTSVGFAAGVPQPLFQTRFSSVLTRAHYRPAPDGQRFLVLAALGRDTVQPISVTLNWAEGLKK